MTEPLPPDLSGEDPQQAPDPAPPPQPPEIPEAAARSAQGWDLSDFQTVPPPVAFATKDFGFAKATEATGWSGRSFAGNWANMHQAGIHRGAYHFFHPGLDPVAQARFFMRAVRAQGLVPGDMLVADIEIAVGADGSLVMSPYSAQRSALLDTIPGDKVVLLEGADYQGETVQLEGLRAPAGVYGRSSLDAVSLEFLNTVHHEAGPEYPVLVYTNRSVGSQLHSCAAAGYGLWIAWPSNTAPSSVLPWPGWLFWQYRWTGGWDGSDQNAFNGTAADLQRWLDKFVTPPAPTPAPPPPPKPPPPKPVPPPVQHIAVEDVMQLNTGENAMTVVSFPAGSARRVTFLNDCTLPGDQAPVLRVAVMSKAHHWSQIVGPPNHPYLTLNPSQETTVDFTATDACGLSVVRQAQGAAVPVAFSFTA